MLNQEKSSGRHFHCGTLSYTKAGLSMLFFWLLWADFSFVLMQQISSNVLPLMLKLQGASNTLMALVISTIPSAMNFVLNPIISTASDRFRSPWGRRIPFIFATTPFMVLFLLLLGFSTELGKGIHELISGFFPALTITQVTVGLTSLANVGFSFFSLFVGTVFYYLFNDVVPAPLLGRFLGLFRVVSSLATALFSFFLLRYAETHTSLLFTFSAVLYGTTLTLMVWKVKEGEYPPPPPGGGLNPLKWIKTFTSECFGSRIYRLVFAYNAVLGVFAASFTFMLLMALSIGLDLDSYGKVTGVAGLVGMVLMYPMGALVDRFHPLRVMLVAKTAYCLVSSILFVFLFLELSGPVAFWVFAGVSALTIPITVANTAAGLPLLMRLFPQEKFGQFCAANAMCSSLGVMLGGVGTGVFLDAMKAHFGRGDFCYRFIPVWQVFFTLLALGVMILLIREWKRQGGDTHYQPPDHARVQLAPGMNDHSTT